MDTQTQDTSTANFQCMYLEDPSLAEGAKNYIDSKRKKKTSRLSCLPCKFKSTIKKERYRHDETGEMTADQREHVEQPTGSDLLPIEFGDRRTNKVSVCTLDQFKWAVVYENQRGFELFSTPYYSSRSLLPQDPPAFTSPDAGANTGGSTHPDTGENADRSSGESSHQDTGDTPNTKHVSKNITLETYTLPDPTWRWVSSSWFVDMKGDGEVQHDGFEYNWSFKGKKWRSKVGWFSAGGFVRRRRWVRLMVRPSDAFLEAEAEARQRDIEDKAGESLIPTYQPSDVPLWRGDERDWQRLCKVSKVIARDGPKLDLWKGWLTDMLMERDKGKYNPPEVSDDDSVIVVANESYQLPNERPLREWVLTILKNHGKEFRSVFVFPDSRVQFGALLLKAGLLQELVPGALDDETRVTTILGPSDFWNQTE